jgi:hypothetical protein
MDIRKLYASLSETDRTIYQQIRTDMRRIYLRAHTHVIGMDKWEMEDDYFLDLIDMKVAVLFDRAGAVDGAEAPVDKQEEKAIEESIEKQGASIGSKKLSMMPPKLVSGWGDK